uniref:Uncharacterized protein n=1 Tax=Corynebacterium imitans TaxID=156978 RepID=A0A076NJ19_9CORY|nr:hypothetical protein [Corynebacterium imitans]AIJ33438.1 hypothetical protein CIMIT_05555 [Corynebacterium imitans]SNV69754.1 Uncharacterised protein [Corynebacterium imitans]
MEKLRDQIRGWEAWIIDLLLEEERDMEEIDRLVGLVRDLRAELKRQEDEILDWARARIEARD